MKIRLGEKEYDLAPALPLTLGDLRRLKKDHGVQLQDLSSMDANTLVKILLLLAQKVDPEVVEAQVDAVPVTELIEISKFLASAATVPDRPTLG